jgi:tRNA pseudouridine32 synthase/23S rRNA pseudouridine746 synthase/23S rRNA pseudouridine1911/1915/1917 synthase
LKAQWKQTEKKYLAVVHGKCEKSSGTITTYLAEDKDYNVYSTADSTKGKLSQTAYKVIRVTNRFSLLEVVLLTGRKNQIRVHLADIGHPIVGDTKYGNKNESQPRMALHARSISFKHPFSGIQLSFASEVPVFFTTLIGRIDWDNGLTRPATSQLKSSQMQVSSTGHS